MAVWLAASQYLQKAAVDHLLGIASTTMPTVYLAYMTSDPGETGSFAGEPTSGGYGRQEITSKMAAFVLATGIAQLGSFVSFPVPSVAQGTITHVALCDSITTGAGNVLWYGELDEPLVTAAGSQPVTFAAGQLSIELSGTNITDVARKAIGDHFLGKSAMTMPTACDFHLFTANPTAAGSFADEADYGSYAAYEDLTDVMAAATLSGSGAGSSYNDTEVAFPAPTSGTNTITYTGISDGEASPALLVYAPLRHAMVVNSGDPAPTFGVNQIAVAMS